MEILKSFIEENDCFKNNVSKVDYRYTNFQNNGPSGIIVHSVGCSQPDPKVFINQWNKPNIEIAVHAIVSPDSIYQCMPWNFRGWHCGGNGNNSYIGIEMTEPDYIKYTNGANFYCVDKIKAKNHVDKCYLNLIYLIREIMKEYKISYKNIISHSEAYKMGLASNHADPEHLWNGLGTSYTMDSLRSSFNNLYRVRKQWDDPSSQIGAFSILENAINSCIKGYCVFDSNGNIVFNNACTRECINCEKYQRL